MALKQLQKKLSNPFAKNIGWLGIAQMLVRVFRLGTTVILARTFTPHDYGLMAIIYTIHGFAEVFTLGSMGGGVTAKVIQTEPEKLDSVCDTAYWISWMMCGSFVVLQCLAAFPIAWFYNDRDLILPICAMGLIYLMYPTFKINSGLIQRENRMKIMAIGRLSQAIVTNLVTVGLALLGMGVWAVIWGMILSTPVWIVINYLNHPWRPPQKFTLQGWQEVVYFGGNMLGIELMDKLRLNLDYLIVGRVLGVDALGLYFFAFSAGLGISKQVIDIQALAMFPLLCTVRDNLTKLKQQYFSSLKIMATVTISLVLVQSSLAPIYVPIIFGDKWVSGVPILIIICLSAIPLMFGLASYQLLNAVGKIKLTLIWNIIYTVLFAMAIAVAVQWEIYQVAIAVLICQGLNLLFSLWVSKYVFRTV